MRKFFILFFLLSLFGYTSYSQTTFEKDSLRYTLNTDGTATVSSCLYLSTSEITIPQTVNDGTQDYTVKKIGDSAFYGKSFVTSVTFPSTLTTFGRYSFSRTGLTSVVIPEGVTTLTFELFSYCDQLTSVTIPEGVTTMERGVFYEDDLLNGVVLPSTLTTIGYHAFGRCIGLTAITIPANVSIIDEYAFQYCSNLETVDLKPQTMTTIGRNAFDSCEKLTAFHVPEGITTLGEAVFYGCKAMQELSLPSTLTSIGYRTFYNCISLPSVTIPEGVTTIGNEAFHYCKLLGGDITLPAGLTSLGSYAFAGCENVESVTFLGNNDVTMPGESQFSSMKKLKSVKLPDNLSTITTSMFFGCNQLQSIDLSRLPATVISPWAFRLCKALASVQLPPATATIGNDAFVYCENLTAISFPSTLKSIGNNAFDNNNLTSLQLNDGLETIGNYAFSGSKDLSASPVVIPQSVTSIGGNAFYNCDQMTSFTFPESLTTLGTYVLASCDNLQTVVFPRNMTVIPRSTCEGCKRLANVTLPENVVTIGLQAFYGATSLPAITLPATVKTIEDNAFRDTNIPSLTLNEGLESIGASAFYNCDQLKTLNIPSTVKNIGNYAFYNCDSILTVTFPEDMTALTTIGTNLFAYNKQLTNVTLPKTGMSSIPNNMFQECDHLRNIQLPATITSIGDHAFYSCDSLQTIYIPDGVKSIGYETFCYCKGLRYVRLPEGLESIGQSCFAYTEKLPFINIPSTVTSMGNWAIHTTASSSNTNFKSIGIMGSTMPGTKDHVFWQYQPAFSLLVPAGQESDYQNSTSWTPDATDNRTIKGYPAEKQTLTQDLIHLSCLDKESYKSGSPEAVWIDWFEGMGTFVQYLKRCNFMLQQGRYVADVAYFIGEDAPKMTGVTDPALPKGYSFDYINADVLRHHAHVKDGRLVLDSGMEYRVLVLPRQETMRPEVLEVIAGFVTEGLCIVGNAPQRSPSLQHGIFESDEMVRKLAAQIWNGSGKGMVYPADTPLARVLDDLGTRPDFSYPEKEGNLLFIHRTLETEGEIYFVSNQEDEAVSVHPSFRVCPSWKAELWDPLTGEVTGWDGKTLSLDRLQSVFVVFRKAAKAPGRAPVTAMPVDGPWTVAFAPSAGNPGFSRTFESLSDWSLSEDPAVKYYSGNATYTGTFILDKVPADASLDLGEAMVIAGVKVNGKDAGGVWTYPYRLPVSDWLQKGENVVEITVYNNWQNRLIADEKLRPEERGTWTNHHTFEADDPLQPSGLLGPVRLLF